MYYEVRFLMPMDIHKPFNLYECTGYLLNGEDLNSKAYSKMLLLVVTNGRLRFILKVVIPFYLK